MSHAVGFALLIMAVLAWIPPAFGQPPAVVAETFWVAARDPGVTLHVREKRPEGVASFGPERIVLFVHGATYPSETGFDLALDSMSWMDFVAQRGWDVYATDIRGYGRSTRPPEMDRPPGQGAPIVNTGVAVRDVGAVVDWIRSRRGVPRISLVGWSWGTTITGAYTAENPSAVERLVLYAPLWLLKDPPPIGGEGPLGTYRTVTRDAARQRGIRGIPPARVQEISPDAAFEVWWARTLATDPVGAAQDPPVLRAPNGVIEDLRNYWMAGRPRYDPGKITVPTLLILAEWDMDTPLYMAQALFERLTAAPRKRLVVIGEGTHAIALEKNRGQLFREVQLFLEEPR
jgi:pimeloyl-ACP methyl ester carboxylesterase